MCGGRAQATLKKHGGVASDLPCLAHTDPMNPIDVLTVAFSTFFGAGVALLVERLTRRRDAKLKEEAALNNLILDLAAKRAFVVSDEWEWADGEPERVEGSIRHARILVREARLQLRPRSKALSPLREMGKACNSFLEHSERDSDKQLKKSLVALTVAMTKEVENLHATRPKRMFADKPGQASFHASV